MRQGGDLLLQWRIGNRRSGTSGSAGTSGTAETVPYDVPYGVAAGFSQG